LKLLLDSHILLWWSEGSPKLGARARSLVESGGNVLFISAASWWEIAIKQALGRLGFDLAAHRGAFVSRGVTTMDVTFAHAEAAAGLPLHHGDPFDRMLVAQASHEGLTLLTRDKKLKVYGSSVLCV
jgi:PIN domain nuclease of toxin-antitoxin system